MWWVATTKQKLQELSFKIVANKFIQLNFKKPKKLYFYAFFNRYRP